MWFGHLEIGWTVAWTRQKSLYHINQHSNKAVMANPNVNGICIKHVYNAPISDLIALSNGPENFRRV